MAIRQTEQMLVDREATIVNKPQSKYAAKHAKRLAEEQAPKAEEKEVKDQSAWEDEEDFQPIMLSELEAFLINQPKYWSEENLSLIMDGFSQAQQIHSNGTELVERLGGRDIIEKLIHSTQHWIAGAVRIVFQPVWDNDAIVNLLCEIKKIRTNKPYSPEELMSDEGYKDMNALLNYVYHSLRHLHKLFQSVDLASIYGNDFISDLFPKVWSDQDPTLSSTNQGEYTNHQMNPNTPTQTPVENLNMEATHASQHDHIANMAAMDPAAVAEVEGPEASISHAELAAMRGNTYEAAELEKEQVKGLAAEARKVKAELSRVMSHSPESFWEADMGTQLKIVGYHVGIGIVTGAATYLGIRAANALVGKVESWITPSSPSAPAE